jgi:hypothetical protein
VGQEFPAWSTGCSCCNPPKVGECRRKAMFNICGMLAI